MDTSTCLAAPDERPIGWSLRERHLAAACEVIQSSAGAFGLERVVGASPAMMALRHLVARIALTPTSMVLLTGEHGTGKKLIARVIHHTSDRASRPFMHIDCSTASERLFDGLLDMLHMADGGAIFLDEVSEMAPTLRARLMRFVDDRRLNVRMIASTSRAADKDLIPSNMLPIDLPPLRSHREDVPLLVEHFVETFNSEFRKRVRGATPGVYTLLQSYSWPANVRELRNLIEHAMLLSSRDRLDACDFPRLTDGVSGGNEFELPEEGVNLDEVERTLLIQALRRCNGNQTRAGSLLGLNRDQIRYRIEKFGLAPATLTH